jgi:hypothetical protein
LFIHDSDSSEIFKKSNKPSESFKCFFWRLNVLFLGVQEEINDVFTFTTTTTTTMGVPRGDARASPLPPCASPPSPA